MRRVLWRLRGEKLLFRSYKPAFQEPERSVGRIVDHEGHFYRITRRVESKTIRLQRGGSVKEWEIWGRAVNDTELLGESEGGRPPFAE